MIVQRDPTAPRNQTKSHVLCANPPSLPKIELTHMVGVSAKGTMLNAISRSDVTGHWEVTLMKMEGGVQPSLC